jgi:uncharacterized protein YraI
MKNRSIAIALAGVLISCAASASAMDVVGSTNPLNIRSGPRPFHPLVASVADGSTLELLGCLSDSTWCSVKTGDKWGWVDGDFLDVDPGDAVKTVNSDRIGLEIPMVTYDENIQEFAGASIVGAVVPGPVGAIVPGSTGVDPKGGPVVVIPSVQDNPDDTTAKPVPEVSLPPSVIDRMQPDYGTTSSVTLPTTHDATNEGEGSSIPADKVAP